MGPFSGVHARFLGSLGVQLRRTRRRVDQRGHHGRRRGLRRRSESVCRRLCRSGIQSGQLRWLRRSLLERTSLPELELPMRWRAQLVRCGLCRDTVGRSQLRCVRNGLRREHRVFTGSVQRRLRRRPRAVRTKLRRYHDLAAQLRRLWHGLCGRSDLHRRNLYLRHGGTNPVCRNLCRHEHEQRALRRLRQCLPHGRGVQWIGVRERGNDQRRDHEHGHEHEHELRGYHHDERGRQLFDQRRIHDDRRGIHDGTSRVRRLHD